MKSVDRLILATLAIGIWALVLKPEETTAHDDNLHDCTVDGSAWGELESGGDVYVYDVSGIAVDCNHY